MLFSREPFTVALRRSKGAVAWCVTVRYEGQILALRVKVRIRVLPAAAAGGGEGKARAHEAELDDVMLGAAAVSEQGVQINRAVGFSKFLHVKDVEGLIERYSIKEEEGGERENEQQAEKETPQAAATAAAGQNIDAIVAADSSTSNYKKGNDSNGSDGAITIEAIVDIKAFYETIDAVR